MKRTNNFDYSKAEREIENINIPNSAFHAKWIKGEGYAIGIENIKITKNYKTLDEALNQVGYGIKIDDNGDEILEKYGETDFETIVRIIKAISIIEETNKIGE